MDLTDGIIKQGGCLAFQGMLKLASSVDLYLLHCKALRAHMCPFQDRCIQKKKV